MGFADMQRVCFLAKLVMSSLGSIRSFQRLAPVCQHQYLASVLLLAVGAVLGLAQALL